MVPDGSPVSERIRAAGWRQGSFVASADRAAVVQSAVDRIPPGFNETYRFIVVTQDCDLVQESDTEPFVEVIGGREVAVEYPLCQNGRNPRWLQVPIYYRGDAAGWLDISIHDRVRIQKEAFAELCPDQDSSLSREDLRVLRNWIAKRYTRPAFPDTFNSRLDAVDRRLERLWKSDAARPVTGIYLAVADEELPPDEPYRIHVRITAKASAWEDSEQRSRLDEFEERLSQILDDCKGVILADDDIQLLPEEDLTVADLRRFKRLDKDYRSPPQKAGTEQPPDRVNEV